MKFEKTSEISSITYMKKVKFRVERGKSGYTLITNSFSHLSQLQFSVEVRR
jgi:hypothetical protein